MATDCCTNGLNQVFCNAFNKYYNTLYTNGEISKEETNNLLIIDYIRQCLSDDRYNSYYGTLLKALRCIANNSCLLDTSWLYDRSRVPKVTNQFVTILTKQAFVETDPTVPQYVKDITQEEIYNWNHPSAQGSLIVTVDPYSQQDNPTYDEIYTAWSSGQDVVARLDDNSGIFQLSYIDDGTIMFIRSDNWNGIYVQYLLLEVEGNTETWTLSPANYLQSKLTFDNNPTQGSNNPVKSSGIYNMCPIIEDTRSSAVAAITGNAPFASLEDGQRMVLKVNKAIPNSPTITLTLSGGNDTSAIPAYSAYQDTVTTVWSNAIKTGMYVELIYESTNNRWMMVGNRDSNTTYPNMTQVNIGAGTSTSANVISPKLVHDNAYIVEETYSSGSLKANKMYDFGTVSSALTIPSLDATNDLVSNALNFYALRFIAGADNISITFPTGVIVDDEPTINTGDYVEIMINLYVENNTNHFYASIKVWQAQ